jgi:glycosyltransferase involved in cell wall biosynthesis
MPILLSALTRYHVFDLALQLQKHGLLNGLVTAYPKSRLGRYASLQSAVISKPAFAVARKATLALDRAIGAHNASLFHEMVYSGFSRAVGAVHRHRDTAVVYGLSGYTKELLDSPVARARTTVVDHGSLHIETEKRILKEECARFGFAPFGNWQYDWLVQRMDQEFNQADYVVCCSDLARETMIQNGVDARKIAVHRLGVDLGAFQRQPNREKSANRRLRLLFVGAMTPLKGLHYLLSTFATMPRDTELWLVGALPTDPVLKKMLADCMRDTDRVKLIGPVPQGELNNIYNQCDVFVLPSLSDGWGMVVSQALACGLPAIVSDMTGAKELITSGQNGFVVARGDPNGLAARIEEALTLCRNGRWHHGIGDATSNMEENSWDDYGNGWAQWLKQIGG